MAPVLDISVVICAWTEDRWDDLVAAVRSVARQYLEPREVIVVVDHHPALLRRVRDALPCVVAIENTRAPGAAGARNSGVAVARGSVVAFLDDDAAALPDWLEQLTRHFADPRVLGSGGSIAPAWQRRRPCWFPPEYDWVVGCSYRGLPLAACPVRNVIAANMAVRRTLFLEIGGFREGFGNVKATRHASIVRRQPRAGDEETEFCIRAARRHPRGVWLYEPHARVEHSVPAARTRPRYFLARCYDEGLGKAAITRTFGPGDALSSERAYLAHTLPRGLRRHVSRALRYGEWVGLPRATAIVAGVAATGFGYGVGRTLGGAVAPASGDMPGSREGAA